jgi:hypothetical protein
VGHLSRFFKQTIRYLYGCLHIGCTTNLWVDLTNHVIGPII